MGRLRGIAAVATLVANALAMPATGRAEGFLGFELLQLDGVRVKWMNATSEQPLTLTYALVDRERAFDEARNCASMTPLEPALASSSIDKAHFEAELHAAFAMWSAVANINFVQVDAGVPANIAIGAQSKPMGYAFTDVHYVRSSDGINAIDRSLICLNPQRRWKIGFDGDLGSYDLRYTIAHEIGHAIGLDHPGASGQMMAFKYDERFRQLQGGDIDGVTNIYGRRADTSAAIDLANENRGADYASAPTR
jgi:Matrixin